MKAITMGAVLMLFSTNLLLSQETTPAFATSSGNNLNKTTTPGGDKMTVNAESPATPGTGSPGMSTLYPTCPGAPTVLHGEKSYNTVLIGTQCWFKENLDIGTMIPSTSNQANNGIIEKYCYSNLPSNCDTYGGLYTWSEMMEYSATPGVQGICPTGWHIATYEEWGTLTTFLGGSGVAGGKMKTTGTIQAGTGLWYDPNAGATNESGFTAVPGGECNFSQHVFYSKGNAGSFWSSSMLEGIVARFLGVIWHSTEIVSSHSSPDNSFSVRCMKVPTVPIVPSSRVIQNIEIPNGQSACYNATQTITVAGSGTLFTVLPGGSATMIAGQNIQLLAGTWIKPLGYFWGYIAPNGPYCLTPSMPAVISSEMELPQTDAEPASFITYPNPTTGRFTLELKGETPVDQVTVEITGLHGKTIFIGTFSGKNKHEFSLSENPVGLYFIQVTSGKKSETGKIIKQ